MCLVEPAHHPSSRQYHANEPPSITRKPQYIHRLRRSVLIGALSYSDRPDVRTTSYDFGKDWVGTLAGGRIDWTDASVFEVIFDVTLADPETHPSYTAKEMPLTTKGSRWAIRGKNTRAVVFPDAPAVAVEE